MSQPVSTKPAVPGVEWKVKAASAGSYLAGVVGMMLLEALSNGSLLAAIPAPYSVLLAPLVPALVALGAGYVTAHTPRTSGLGADVDDTIKMRVSEAMTEVAGRIQRDKDGAQ